MCVCVCVCVCGGREGERERESVHLLVMEGLGSDGEAHSIHTLLKVSWHTQRLHRHKEGKILYIRTCTVCILTLFKCAYVG